MVSYTVMNSKPSPQIVVDGPGLTGGGRLDVTITVHATIAVDAASARRKATGWLVSEVGNLLIGGDPALVIADRTAWRVPVLLTSPERGVVGQIGAVDVDATTGEVLSDDKLIQELTERGRQAARSTPPPAE
jgi:hypothetical protein